MPIKEEKLSRDKKTAIFETTPKMSTYLLAFAVGNFIGYRTVSKHGVEITAYAGLHQKTDDLKYAGDFAADVLDFYDDCFKTPFPLPKMDLLALPDFEAGAMENWGLVTYREIAMLANEKSSLNQKLYVCTVVAHELSHMWFGDLVTMQWWNDLWLNEGMATWMQWRIVEKWRPALAGRVDDERAGRRREQLAALLALAQVPLVGLGLVRAERVERVRSGQVVGVHDVSVPGSPSSSRMRDSPPNIRLLMVPSGWPSLSASSDWVNPP
jgi:aminopeptidase N